ncbi:MAG TPA: hypothetical protein VEA78_06355, partial [Acidimicrobiales bacterium]|nr:hypothetical protein [Acidimicrobiales bacterium]
GSRRADPGRTDMSVGPIDVQVIEPLRKLRLVVGDNDSGVTADLTFTRSTAPMQEPRFTRHAGARVVMDYTRLTQFGTWSGWVVVDGERIEVSDEEVVGSRDRSWGIRTVGERDAGAPTSADFVMPQFFWLWAPMTFDDTCFHFDVQEDGDGRRWHWNGELAPVGGESTERAVDVSWHIDWTPGTRRASAATITLSMLDGSSRRVDLEPIVDFQMLGIGYMHPEWSHGSWKGELAVGVERWALADLDPMAFPHLHVQALCRATRDDGAVGIGILEQLVIGPHAPSGFTELLDGAR